MLQFLNSLTLVLFMLFYGVFTSLLLSSKWSKIKIIVSMSALVLCVVSSSYTTNYRYEYGKSYIISNVESMKIEDFNDWFSGSQFKTREIRDLETISHLGVSNPKINHNVSRCRWEYSYNCDKYVVHFFIDDNGNCSDFNKVRRSRA